MRWIVHGERAVYESPWLRVTLADVEVPEGTRFEHHVVRAPRHAAGVVVVNEVPEVLLLWRHRFITDTWGWEIPAGAVEPDEDVVDAAQREVLEETGWAVRSLTPLISYHPTNGISDQTFDLFVARDAVHRGDPEDDTEAERVEWVPLADLKQSMAEGSVTDGLTLTALSYAIAFNALA